MFKLLLKDKKVKRVRYYLSNSKYLKVAIDYVHLSIYVYIGYILML